ncbi:arrestin domain containing protein [Metarhizium album ARSEF 1941]|uniref:Arrestin domain containing protein n=1 Tax=Metarhizium album (strain ARSEF 1941) TaxID=1081103 RepID=A0A0B2X4C7_METAS|nr:arrestin domain containing protein [Metarhizium album ARSEF 1941]KHO01204.1 arrestin domain containing protein [Metarhizium album ARSEF 1941]
MTASRQQRRRRSGPWLETNSTGIFYRPEAHIDICRPPSQEECLPTPLISPRRSRPHAIHVVTYPSGYVPRELRADAKANRERTQRNRGERSSSRSNLDPGVPLMISGAANPGTGESTSNYSSRRNSNIFHNKRIHSSTSSSSQIFGPVLGKLIASISGLSPNTPQSSPLRDAPLTPTPGQAQVPALSAIPAATPSASTGVLASPAYDDAHQDSAAQIPQQAHQHRPRLSPAHSHLHCLDEMAVVNSIANSPAAYNIASQRNSLMSVRSAKSAVTSLVTEVPKPVASGSGVTCSIVLAERNIFLTGFDHDGHVQSDGQGGTALLRGKLQLNVTKNVKIKAVQLKLLGRARTEWPEGIPPLKQDVCEEESLRTQVLTFFNATHDGWEGEYGNQCTFKLKSSSANSSSTSLSVSHRPGSLLLSSSSRGGLTARELKRLSLQNTQSRSFGTSENGLDTGTQVKGFKVFYPGTYDYSFELPIDHHQLETIKLQYGSVKWELHASVDRAGAFKPNLHGTKEVSVVRLPDQMSLETTEPISISRQWEDQLHYDIVISGKSFPIGSKIPIAFKLTPLAKVQLHKLKVYVTESIEYWTKDKRVTRKDQGRKILLLEKAAGKPLDASWATSDLTTVRGGELEPDQRRQAREIASLRRTREAQRRGRAVEPLPEPSNNMLGDLDLGLEHMWGSTEIEANVQLPTCQMMARSKDLRLHPDCSWKSVNVYHWIKIVLRISRVDPEDPLGKKRRHFEISIDSPFTVLNCRATQANTNLPAYASPNNHQMPQQSACGCPDAASLPYEGSPNSSTGALPGTEPSNDGFPLSPRAAHVAHSAVSPMANGCSALPSMDDSGIQGEPRPIHLLRVPSFNPPAFDDDAAPPPLVLAEDQGAAHTPLMTPPPQYDAVIGTPSVDGLADYFTRLANAGYRNEDDDSGSDDSDEMGTRILERSGRVNVAHPRAPGGRMPSRSLEISRRPMDPDHANVATQADGSDDANAVS